MFFKNFMTFLERIIESDKLKMYNLLVRSLKEKKRDAIKVSINIQK